MKYTKESEFTEQDKKDTGTCRSTYGIIRALEAKEERERKAINETTT